NIGFIHYFLKNFEKAEKSLEIAISLDPKLTDSYNLLGQLLMRRQDDAGALQLFLKALQINPNLKDVHFNVGMIYLRAGNLDAAVTSYNEALRVDPSFSLAHYNLATILRHQGKKDEALLHFEKALENPSELIDIAQAKQLIAELKKPNASLPQVIKK
ncbi:MAG: tetratricopeptide repeat protein, partial [Pseudomonadota bacterium]